MHGEKSPGSIGNFFDGVIRAIVVDPGPNALGVHIYKRIIFALPPETGKEP
jgi:hypothetical protein